MICNYKTYEFFKCAYVYALYLSVKAGSDSFMIKIKYYLLYKLNLNKRLIINFEN